MRGNADFFDRKYDIIKMNGKWWMNENLKYPRTSDFHMPPASTYSGLAYACPSDIVSGYSPGTPKCDLINSLGYLYAIFNTDICPTGWALPSESAVDVTNTSAGGINPHRVSGKWNTTQIQTHSIYDLSGYWGSTGIVNYYLWGGSSTWFVNMTSLDTTSYWEINSFKSVAAYLGHPAYSYQARCIKN